MIFVLQIIYATFAQSLIISISNQINAFFYNTVVNNDRQGNWCKYAEGWLDIVQHYVWNIPKVKNQHIIVVLARCNPVINDMQQVLWAYGKTWC